MRKKQLLLWAGALLTAAFAGVLVIRLACAPRVTEENYQKVHDGMRLSDVETLLGPPTGDRVPAVNFLYLCSSSGTLREEYAAFAGTDEGLQWHDDGGSMIVGFRPGGTVTFKRYDPAQEESWRDRVRRWLGL